jgi:hypothetical protein
MKTTITRRSFLRAIAVTAIVPTLPLPELPIDIRGSTSTSTTGNPFGTVDIKRLVEKLREMEPEPKPESYYAFCVHTDLLYGIKRPSFLTGDVTA